MYTPPSLLGHLVDGLNVVESGVNPERAHLVVLRLDLGARLQQFLQLYHLGTRGLGFL